MKIISKYIYKQIFTSFIIGFIVFTSVLLLNNLFQIFDLLINKGVSIFDIIKLVGLMILSIFTVTVPMSLLFSVILTYSRMAEDNEIIALNSSAVNTFVFTYQPIILSVLVSLVLCWLNLSIVPKVESKFRNLYFSIAKKQPILKFQKKTFNKIGNYRIYIDDIDKKNEVLKGITIYQFEDSSLQGSQRQIRIIAKTGKVSFDSFGKMFFSLNNGIIQTWSENLQDKFTHFSFENYLVSIQTEKRTDFGEVKTLREMTGKELIDEIKRYKIQGIPTTYLETEYYLRWAIGFSAVSLVIIGLPLGIIAHRGGRTISFGLSILILCLYYFL
ncbi:MAG: LptF/LptG family permease, partial [Endomicrobiia bacterium]